MSLLPKELPGRTVEIMNNQDLQSAYIIFRREFVTRRSSGSEVNRQSCAYLLKNGMNESEGQQKKS